MSKFRFFPDDFEVDSKLMAWCKKQGLSEKQVSEQLERILDHEFQPMRSCPTRTFRRWIRNAIQWSHVTPTVQKEYRTPQELSEDERKRDAAKAIAQMEMYRNRSK